MQRCKRRLSTFQASLLHFISTPFPARLVLLGIMAASATSPVLAQAGDPGVKPMSARDKRINFVDKQLAPQIAQDFKGSLAAVREFLVANPRLDPWERVEVYTTSGSLLYSNTPSAKRGAVADEVLQLLDEGLQEAKATKFEDPFNGPRAILELGSAKMVIVLAEKRTDQAGQVLDQPWPTVVSTWDHVPVWYQYWRDVRNLQGQPQKAVDGLVKTFEQRALLHDRAPTPVSIAIADELLSQGKTAEALSWAKLAFAVCDFDEPSIREATQVVNRCLSVGQMTMAKANLFAQAQTDADAPNPLDRVPLSRLDTAAIRAELAKPEATLSPVRRLTCLLLVGDYRDAMLSAKNRLITDVANQDAALQVARVFKAKDADVARANAFLAYYQSGEGDNPVPTFLKETEAAAPKIAAP